jgi:cyclic pyranopterin phosphate synthase
VYALPILRDESPERYGAFVPGSSVRAAPRAVRLSITDRCDLACVYCRPGRHDGYLPGERRLEAKHWAHLAEGLLLRGVRRFRITGGEPLVHPDVVEIVRAIAALPGVEDLALTTNATRLAELARPLRDAGLRRLNVSIDSLRDDRFAELTRGGRLRDVLQGIETARRVGFDELKTNTVVVAKTNDASGNDDELVSITRWAWSVDATPRFLELMTVGEGAKLRDRVVPYAAMRAALVDLVADDPLEKPADRGPARYAHARDGSGKQVGFITGTSDTFCDGCDRLRTTSEGALRPCLATTDQVDVSRAIREGDVEGIARGLDAAWEMKPDGKTWKGCTESTAASVNMRATGG